jgi:Transposase DDE domain group 1
MVKKGLKTVEGGVLIGYGVIVTTQNIRWRRPPQVKYSKREITCRAHKIPELRFEDQNLTSFAGLIIFQPLFSRLQIKERLRACFRHGKVAEIFGLHVVMLLLVVHLLLGFRRLRDLDYYKDDPIVQRLLGLKRLPDVSTVCRALKSGDEKCIQKVRHMVRQLIIDRLRKTGLSRLTMDFDGSVLSTSGRKAEGTAVGFNKKKKGARSYYPLFCTIAQTGQVFDVLCRPGNVHDSKGAREFILFCVQAIREALPGITIEVRMDSAFFSDEIVTALDRERIEFTLSVPFERFAELKELIQNRLRWRRLQKGCHYFETQWKPKKWKRKFRFLFIRQHSKEMQKGMIQLDFFIPYEYGYEYKVTVTNKTVSAKKVLAFHQGRGQQENVFGELKSQGQLDYIPVRRLYGNQLYMMASILAHNLNRELQMATAEPERGTTEKRAPLWKFTELKTLRQLYIQRAGRLTNPQGRLTLTMSDNETVKQRLLEFLDSMKLAA